MYLIVFKRFGHLQHGSLFSGEGGMESDGGRSVNRFGQFGRQQR